MNIQGKEILPSDVIALMRRAEEAEREREELKERLQQAELKRDKKVKAYCDRCGTYATKMSKVGNNARAGDYGVRVWERI